MSDSSDYALVRTGAGSLTGLTGVVWVTGPDTVSFLDGLLSQNVAAMAPGAVAPSLLLAPNGKLRATLWLLRGEQRVGLACDAGAVDTVVSDLSRFKIRVDAEIAVEERTVWDVWGPQAPAIAPGLPAGPSWTDSDGVVFRYPFRHSDLPRIVVIGAAPSATRVSPEAATAVRIEVGEPVMGLDLTESTIPQEGADVAAAVDFTKGCYLGQELVARIDSRGHVNRRLEGFVFAGPELPPAGGEIVHDDKAVGVLTSIAWSPGMDAPVGLGMVRVEVAPGAAITVAGRRGSVVSLPIKD